MTEGRACPTDCQRVYVHLSAHSDSPGQLTPNITGLKCIAREFGEYVLNPAVLAEQRAGAPLQTRYAQAR